MQCWSIIESVSYRICTHNLNIFRNTRICNVVSTWVYVSLPLVVSRYCVAGWLRPGPSLWVSSAFGQCGAQQYLQKKMDVHIKRMCWAPVFSQGCMSHDAGYCAALDLNQISCSWLLRFQNGQGITEQSGSNVTHYLAHRVDVLVRRMWGGGTPRWIKVLKSLLQMVFM